MRVRSAGGIIFALWIAEITGTFETAMIFAAQRALTAEFGDPVLVGWLITSYLLIGAGAAALAGRLGDIFGRRRLLIIMLAIGMAGSLLSGFSPNYPLLLAGRCLQGFTGAILALCVGLARENLPPQRVPMGIGLIISGASVGTASGLVIGGFFVDQFSWHAVFLASGVFSACAIAAAWWMVPKSKPLPAAGPLDWVGGVLFVPAIFALLIAISYGPTWGLADWRTLLAVVVALIFFAAWIRASLSSPNPLLDVRLFANRQVLVSNAVTALVSMGTLQIALVFSLLLQAPKWTVIGLGASATLAGLIKFPSNVSSLAAAPLSGWMTSRGGGRTTMILGGIVTTIGWLLAMAFGHSLLTVGLVLVIISFGATVQYAVAPAIITAAVPPDRTSEAIGTMTITRQAFLGIGAQMVSVLLASQTIVAPEGGARYPSSGAFMLTMSVIVGVCVVATLLALALPRNAGVEPGRSDGAAAD